MTPSAPPIEVHMTPAEVAGALADDVRKGLGAQPKTLPPKWLYDPAGCDLFERICELPEYYPTRTERSILARRAGDVASITGASTVVELGSGTSEKTRLVLDSLRAAGTLRRFVGFDVAEPTLRSALVSLGERYPGMDVAGVVGDFERHLDQIPAGRDRLVIFLGGTIGNLEPPARRVFLASLGSVLDAGEWLLLGTDLVKEPRRLIAAYDDSQGVTAEFNRNILSVINKELGARFDLAAFDHLARWNPDEEWIEMRLRSRRDQRVEIPALEMIVDFDEGEEMLTEISAKFRVERLEHELRAAGFEARAMWVDEGGDFAVSLSRRVQS